MTIAAIYDRKSTEQERGESGDSLSVEEQIAGAKAFVGERGWWLGQVFNDEAVSGWTVPLGERPGGKALLAAARAKSFNILVMRNESRLGREMADNLTSLVMLTGAGIRVFYTATGQEVTLRTAKDKLVASIGHFGAEDYAERVSADTRRGKLRRAREGHWQGSRVFGYRKRETLGAKGERRYVDLEVEPTEAAVVRFIFEKIAEGWGLLRITNHLREQGTSSPRGRGWAVTSIRHMLDNPLYRGVYRYQGRKEDGSRETVETPKPELWIIPEDLWRAAHARMARTRQVYTGHRKASGTLQGRPESGLVSRHLLAGHLRCGECGANLFVASRVRKGGKVTLYYLCTSHHKQGVKACSNRFAVPYEKVTQAILGHFTDLEPGVLTEIMIQEWARRLKELEDAQGNRDALQAELVRLDGELVRLADAIASGSAPATILQAIRQREAERRDLQAKLEHLDGLARAQESQTGPLGWSGSCLAWRASRPLWTPIQRRGVR